MLKQLGTAFLVFAAVVGALHVEMPQAQAGCGPMPCAAHFHAGYHGVPPVGAFAPGYGAYRAYGPHGVARGAFGVARDAWYGPLGRYPKLAFAAPLRRGLGLPGFTPIRQFLFGRGAIRRQTRRAFLFGRCFRC